MKIERIEPIAIRLPLTKPMKMAGITLETADNVLVRIDGEGLSGWGEAASAPTMTGETVESIMAAIHYLTPSLLGRDAQDLPQLLQDMDQRLYANSSAKAAMDIALHDLLGRAVDKPIWALLGPQRRARLSVLWLLGNGQTDADTTEAAQRQEEGFTAFKIKVGVHDPAFDIRRTRAICEGLHAQCLIAADANQGWTVEQAVHYVSALAASPLTFVEQPVAAHDLAGMARVRAASRMQVGADEGIHGLDDIHRHRETGAAQGVSLKSIKLGGIRRVYEAALLCERLGMQVNLAGKVAESSLGTAAVLHLAATIPSVDWGVSPACQYLADDVVTAPIVIQQGQVVVPCGPGLGVQIDEAKVERYRCRV